MINPPSRWTFITKVYELLVIKVVCCSVYLTDTNISPSVSNISPQDYPPVEILIWQSWLEPSHFLKKILLICRIVRRLSSAKIHQWSYFSLPYQNKSLVGRLVLPIHCVRCEKKTISFSNILFKVANKG